MNYEEEVLIEEGKQLFGIRMYKLEWQLDYTLTMCEIYSIFCRGCILSIEERIISPFLVTEETYGFATSLYGILGRK